MMRWFKGNGVTVMHREAVSASGKGVISERKSSPVPVGKKAGAYGAALVTAFGLSACVGERDFPRPAQMCKNLVQACGQPVLLEQERSIFRECYDVGRDGVQDPKNEAQCFAFYDECLNECEYWGYWYSYDAGLDASVEAGAYVDAQLPDATTARDE